MSSLSKDFIHFFIDLKKNNNKEWFHANKKSYEEHVKTPFQLLVENILDRIREVDSNFTMPANKAIMRINRDIRFSKDKTPYNLRMAAMLVPGDKKSSGVPGLFFHVDAKNVVIGGGCHNPEKEQLKRLRKLLVDNHDEALELLTTKEFKKTYGGLVDQKYKRLPADLAGHEDKELLYQKTFHFYHQYEDPAKVIDPKLADFIFKHYMVGKPFNDFLSRSL